MITLSYLRALEHNRIMPKPFNYFLCSKRIGFRWWTIQDLDFAKILWGNPEVTNLFTKAPLSDFQIEERLQSEIERETKYQMQYWPMFELATDRFVGCGGLRPYRLAEQIFELGFHLRPEFWGKGLATEAGETLISYGFKELGASAIFAGHHPDNTSSRNVLFKLGFEETGTEFYEPTGLLHPSYLLQSHQIA